ncbi:MAG: hypothetical protein P1V20_07410 [Verrucomicrobiales bacterium]|nr:hypothetical protein [Verrucomicrobiales bacterium]
MTGVLIQKELRRHWPAFLLLGFLTWSAIFIAAFRLNADGTGAGAFTGVGWGLFWLIPVTGIILGRALISSEYQAKTQIFLEGLPLPKWRMITLKLVLGFLLTCIYTMGSIAIGWLISMGAEIVTPKFLGIMTASACGWSLFVTGFFLVTGFLGRYRLIIYLTLALSIRMIRNSSIPIREFPPFALIDSSRFGLEKEVWPVFDLQVTGLIILGWIVAAYTLGLAKEGNISSMLGEKMSYREKMFIGGAFGIGFMTLFPFILNEPKPEPFDIPGAVEEEWEGVVVKISPEELEKPVDLEVAIAGKLARRLAKQRDWLGISKEDFPGIFIVEKSDIDEEERIDWEEIPEENVVLMYAGYRQPEFSENRLLSWTLSQVVRKYSKSRVSHEDRWWVVCGLEGLWEMEQTDADTIKAREQMAAKTVKQHGLTIDNLMGWSKYQDDVEWRNADAVAWMGMRKLEQTAGSEAVRTFARMAVAHQVTRTDGRAVAWDYLHPVTSAFEKATGESLENFVTEWRDYILSVDIEKEDVE